MGTQKKPEQKPQETREADTEHKPSSRPNESHEGVPGYGQPPPDVSDKPLPDQKW